MQLFQRIPRVVLIGVGILIILLIAVGSYFVFVKPRISGTQTSVTITNTNGNQNSNQSSTVSQNSDVKFLITSKIPEYNIKSIDGNVLKDVLTKLGLYPFTSLAYIGEPVNGKWNKDQRSLNPKEVDVTIYPMSGLDSKISERKIWTLTTADNKPIVTYLAGHLNVNGKFDLPVYIDTVNYKVLQKPTETLLTKDVLFGVFINFQSGPYSQTVDYYRLFNDKVGKLEIIIRLN